MGHEAPVRQGHPGTPGVPNPSVLHHPQADPGHMGRQRAARGLSGSPSASVWGPGGHLLV